MATRRCGECKQDLPKGMKMKKHWQEVHPEKLAKIKAWLGETDEKIKSAEVLAREGMRGPGEVEYAPK